MKRRDFLGGVAALPLVGGDSTVAETKGMKLAIGADHAGFPLKAPVIALLKGLGTYRQGLRDVHPRTGRFP